MNFALDAAAKVQVANLCVGAFQAALQAALLALPILFLARVIYFSISGDLAGIASTLRAMVLFLVLSYGYKELLNGLLDLTLSGEGANLMSNDVDAARQSIEKAAQYMPDFVIRFFETIQIVLFWAEHFLYLLLLLVLSVLAPVVFLLGTMLGFNLGIRIFVAFLITVSLWPLASQWIDHLMEVLIAAAKGGAS